MSVNFAWVCICILEGGHFSIPEIDANPRMTRLALSDWEVFISVGFGWGVDFSTLYLTMVVDGCSLLSSSLNFRDKESIRCINENHHYNYSFFVKYHTSVVEGGCNG